VAELQVDVRNEDGDAVDIRGDFSGGNHATQYMKAGVDCARAQFDRARAGSSTAGRGFRSGFN
jgi:hypothetical protein